MATDRVGNVTTQTVRVLRDTAAPSLAFLAPIDGTYFDPTAAPLELRWGDSGTGVDPATLQITADGAPLAVTCSACGTGVVCIPTNPPTGQVVTLAATVEDGVGADDHGAGPVHDRPERRHRRAGDRAHRTRSAGSVTNQAEAAFIGELERAGHV